MTRIVSEISFRVSCIYVCKYVGDFRFFIVLGRYDFHFTYGSGNMVFLFCKFFNFHRSLTGQPPLPDFPAPPPFEFEDAIETEVRTPVPENELVEDIDCTMLFPELFSLEFPSLN